MAGRRGWILLTLGLVLAVGAGVLVFLTLQRQAEQAREEARLAAEAQFATPPTTSVLVAARALEPGTMITSADFVARDYPVDLVPTGAITQSEQLDQQILVTPVGEGETFQSNQLLGGEGAALSQQLEPGNLLFAFPIVDLLGQSNLIRDGDRLDLFLTLNLVDPNGPPIPATALTLQNVRVFRVLRPEPTEENPNPSATALLLSIAPEDAAILKLVKDSGGVIDFTLRSALDTDDYPAAAIDLPELISRFEFR